MQDLVDLHLHSTFSDGRLTPAELVARAAGLGLRAIAIADHDNVDGIAAAMAAGRHAGVEIISGVELSVVWNEHQDIHLLGYGFDHNDPVMREALRSFREFRANRSRQILDKVNARLLAQQRHSLDFSAIDALAGGTIGRPHIGQALVNAGHVRDMEEAFQNYLVPCNVAKRFFPMDEAIAMLHAAGGCAVLAHPPFIKASVKELETMVDEFTALGLDGMEVYNSGADNATADRHLTLARRRSLIITGGSDFHRDEAGGVVMGRGKGNLRVPYRCVEEIRSRAARYHAS